MTRGRISTIGGCVAFFSIAIGLIGPVNGWSTTAWRQCLMTPVPPRERITHCTTYLQSGDLSPQELARAFRIRGDAYHETGDLERAIEDYDAALLREPDNAAALTGRGAAHAEKGAFDLAIEAFERVVVLLARVPIVGNVLDPYLGLPAFRISQDRQALEFSGDINARAAKEFEQVLAAEPAIRLVHLQSRGGYVHEANRMARAIRQRNLDTAVFGACLSACTEVFLAGRERIIGLASVLGFHRDRARGMTQERPDAVVEYAARLRQTDASDAFAQRASQTGPDDMWFPPYPDLLKERVATRSAKPGEGPTTTNRLTTRERKATDFLIKLIDRPYSGVEGDSEREARYLDVILHYDPHEEIALMRRASIFLAKGDFARAIADYDELIRLDPKSVSALIERGLSHWLMNDTDQALRDLNEALRFDRNNLQALLQRGWLLQGRQENSRAIEDYNRALTFAPDHSELHAMRASAYLSMNDRVRALEGANRSILLHENAPAFRVRGLVHELTGENDLSIEAFDQAIRLDPADSVALRHRCWVRSLLGRLEAALSDCNEAVRVAPDDPGVLTARGLVHLKSGAIDEALADLDIAVQRDPGRVYALYARGLARHRKGDLSGAEADITAATAIQPTLPDEFLRYGFSGL